MGPQSGEPCFGACPMSLLLKQRRARDRQQEHRVSTQLELLFDLVIVTGTLIFASGIGHVFEPMVFSLGLAGWIIMRRGMVALWPLALTLLALWGGRDRYMSLGARLWALPLAAAAILAATTFTTEPLIFAAIMIATLLWRAPMPQSEGHHP